MNPTINCGLKGSYKVDIFSGKELMSTTDWFSNNITNTGLTYPFTFPFARCFMYLSLGSGRFGVPSATGCTGFGDDRSMEGIDHLITTGIASYTVENSTAQPGQYIGWQAYAIEYPSACGTTFTPYGVEMSRGWKIPSGADLVLKDQLDIHSLMLSPTDNSNLTGKYAFSLVNQVVSIPGGCNATIYYKLSLNFPEYYNLGTIFSGVNGQFNTGNASMPTAMDTGLVSGWTKVSGIYKQIFPGLQVVNNNGACVVLGYGDQMEPSRVRCTNANFYFSPDISEFSTSPYGTGNIDSSTSGLECAAYNSNGLSANFYEYIKYLKSNGITTHETVEMPAASAGSENAYYLSGESDSQSSYSISLGMESDNLPINGTISLSPVDIHLKDIKNISGYNTTIPGFKYNSTSYINAQSIPINYATPGVDGWDHLWLNRGQPAIFSTSLRRKPVVTGAGRSQSVTKFARVSPIQAPGYNSRYGSLVLAYAPDALTAPDSSLLYPYMEYLFYDISGRGANCPHYRIIPEIYMVDRGTGVLQAIFTISGSGQGIDGSSMSPIQRLWSVTGFMGPYSSSNISGLDINYSSNFSDGILFSGNAPLSSLMGDFNGDCGYGAVYGIKPRDANYNNLPYDTCLLDKPNSGVFLGRAPEATGETGLLCWPNSDNKISLFITGMKYSGSISGGANVSFTDYDDLIIGDNYQFVNDITWSETGIINRTSGTNNSVGIFTGIGNMKPITMSFLTVGSRGMITGYKVGQPYRGFGSGISGSSFSIYRYSGGAAISGSGIAFQNFLSGDMRLSPTNFKKPIGRIHHLETFSGSGYRLLPNFADANINFQDSGSNVYQPTRGGSFPGMSMENGMELYFDFTWSG